MNKYIVPGVITILVIVVVIFSIVSIVNHLNKESFGNVDLSYDGVDYSSIVDPVPPAIPTEERPPTESKILITDPSGNIETLPFDYIALTLDYLDTMTKRNKTRINLVKNALSVPGGSVQEINTLKEQITALTTEVNTIKNSYLDKTKELNIMKSNNNVALNTQTLFTDAAGPNTVVGAFGKVGDHPGDNKFRLVQ